MTIHSLEGTPPVAVHGVGTTAPRGTSAPASSAPAEAHAVKPPPEQPKESDKAPPPPVRKVVSLPDFPQYELSFRLDEERGRVVVRVIDAKTGTVVRSIPPEELGKTLKSVPDPRGLLLDNQS